jgi:two-component system sensor histidine kinase and response regulator WspE
MSDAGFSMMDLFREEVRTHTSSLAAGLLALESELSDARQIEPLMRAAHSIKGAARIVGLDPAVGVAHALEDALVAAQEGRLKLNSSDIDLCLRATDILASLEKLDEKAVEAWAASQTDLAQLIEMLRTVAHRKPSPPKQTSNDAAASQRDDSAIITILEPQKESATAKSDELPVTDQEPSRYMDVSHKVDLQEAQGSLDLQPSVAESMQAAPGSASAQAESVVRVSARSLTRLMSLAGESLVQARWLQPFATSLAKLKKHHDHLAELLDGLAIEPSEQASSFAGLVAEVRRQSTRCRLALAERISEFEDHAAHAESLNGRLYGEVIASRMRPFAEGTHAFPRMVRDLARNLGKQVRLEIVGQTTEVDRDILDRLESPLTHLLRNAIDHGVETPDVRRAAGKPDMGLVRLAAHHRAGMLVLEVSDDGAGINLERLRSKVIERGLAPTAMTESMAEAELLEFLFLPGFSTASAVTEVSGRGVGLDVVQDALRKIGGSVQVRTRLGQGTSFHLQLPITLSVMRAAIVEIAGEPYAFPHNRIDRLIMLPRAGLASLENRPFVSVDGRNVGLVLAAQLFDLPAVPPSGEDLPVLLVSDSSGQYGVVVEAFRGEQDLVVRPLDPRLGKVPNISAAAILDNGMPVLFVDVEDLVRSMDHLIQTGTLARCAPARPEMARRKRVLVVDDSITVREVERQLLRQRGYDVAVAVDGREGLHVARGERFDLIVTDVDMPRMNGLELVQALKSEPSLREVPVIIVSYKDRDEDRLRGLEVGADYYLTKSSFHDDTFVGAVRDLIGEP